MTQRQIASLEAVPQRTARSRGLRAMALGFGIGSILFAVGAVLAADNAPELPTCVVFAVGAVCFTAAAFVQWRRAVAEGFLRGAAHPGLDWSNPDWLSAVAQLLGTLYFNVMTLRALALVVNPEHAHTDVWHPNVIGSVLFLISSVIALEPESRFRRHTLVRGRSWWICWANMLGSVFFAASALAAKPTGLDPVSSALWNNGGTFFGAIGFLIAAVLLWPPALHRLRAPAARHH
ncbi:MAG: hypothetical protein WCP28_01825 [Actinomycetes bacterium]